MNHGDVCDRRVGLEVFGHFARARHGVERFGVFGARHARLAADVGQTHAVSAVAAHEHALVGADDARKDRLVAEGAATLHEHGRIQPRVCVGKLEQRRANLLGNALVVIVPSAVVERHLLLDGTSRRKGAGSQKLVRVFHRFIAFLYPFVFIA